MFDQAFLDEMKSKLKKEEQRILSELKARGVEHPGDSKVEADFPQYGKEEEDNAQEVAEYETKTSVETNLEKTLQDIRLALKKVDDSIYGACADCGGKIERNRLEILPYAQDCIACQKKNPS